MGVILLSDFESFFVERKELVEFGVKEYPLHINSGGKHYLKRLLVHSFRVKHAYFHLQSRKSGGDA